MSEFSPREIVSELDKHIVAQSRCQTRRSYCASLSLAA